MQVTPDGYALQLLILCGCYINAQHLIKERLKCCTCCNKKHSVCFNSPSLHDKDDIGEKALAKHRRIALRDITALAGNYFWRRGTRRHVRHLEMRPHYVLQTAKTNEDFATTF